MLNKSKIKVVAIAAQMETVLASESGFSQIIL